MNYFDPARPRLGNGKPSWLTAPQVALPVLILEPTTPTVVKLSLMINCSWKHLRIYSDSIQSYINAWIDSPEGFALNYFNATASPTAEEPYHQSFPIDPSELGL